MIHDIEMIERVYGGLTERLQRVRQLFGRPLTLTEKILGAHLADELTEPPRRRETNVLLNPDRLIN